MSGLFNKLRGFTGLVINPGKPRESRYQNQGPTWSNPSQDATQEDATQVISQEKNSPFQPLKKYQPWNQIKSNHTSTTKKIGK